MTFTSTQIDALKAPLDRKHVKQRAQAGRQLSYIESWQAISEANRIFGFDAWDSTTHIEKLFDAYKDAKDKWRVGYMARVTINVFVNGSAVKRDGVGYGSGIDNDVGQAHESALKEAESDARKRALMTFGNPFGLALYDKEQVNVTDGSASTSTNDEAPPKNAPGVSKARQWVTEFIRDGMACDNGGAYMELCKGTRTHWVKICGVYPNLYVGPDGSGLRGEALKIATIMECRDEFDLFVQHVESSAEALKQPQQAAAE